MVKYEAMITEFNLRWVFLEKNDFALRPFGETLMLILCFADNRPFWIIYNNIMWATLRYVEPCAGLAGCYQGG